MAKSSEAKDGKYWYQYMFDAEHNANVPVVSRMLKEFPTLKSGELQLKLHIKTLRSLGASLDVTSERVKSNERSQQLRNYGNKSFSSGEDTTKVAEIYTQSIAYALPGSQELAMAYANRSAVSFKAENYEDCLMDIERSLETNYPEEIRAKLFARRVRCLVTLKKSPAEIEEALKDTRESLLKMDQNASGRDLVEKTLNDENHMAPTTSTKKKIDEVELTVEDDDCDIRGATGITVQYSKKYGRHIVATRDIRTGEMIAVIDNYAEARDPEKCYRECSHCIKETTIGIPCDHCVNVIYCSTACRDKAWEGYHVIECPILGILLDLSIPSNTLLGMKITLKAIQEAGGVDELQRMVKELDSVSDPRMRGFTGNVFDCTKYACIYSLASHAGKQIDDSFYISLITTFIIYYLATQTEIFGKKHDRSLGIFDKNPLLIFLGGLMIRNCEIVQVTGLRDGSDDRNKHEVLVAPFTGLCNHSCNPNMISFAAHNTIAFAVQPIKAGEQIWDNYMGLHYSRVPKSERQQLLKRDYHFTCDCVACIKDWPMLDKLPSFMDIAPQMEKQFVELQSVFLLRMSLANMGGNMNMWNAKDELIALLEFLYEHACPCKEIITYQNYLTEMFAGGLENSP